MSFSVLIIPHTLNVTTLGGWRAGGEVNLEVDLMARYAARLDGNEVDGPANVTEAGLTRVSTSNKMGCRMARRRRRYRMINMADARRAPLKDQTDIAGARALIVEARFYDDIQDALLEGAVAELKAAGVGHDVITVPGRAGNSGGDAIALDAAENKRQALRCGDRARLRGPGRHHPFRIVSMESSRGADGSGGGAESLRSATASSRSIPRRRPGRGRARASSTRAATLRARRWQCCGSSAGWQRHDDGSQEQQGSKPKGPDKKANRRGAARLAAVQALYQMESAAPGSTNFAEFESHWLGNEVEGDKYLPAEAAFFRDVVSGVVRDQA